MLKSVAKNEPVKQVAVRMSPSLHRKAIRKAKTEKESFSEFVRRAVQDRLEILSRWRKA